MADIVTINGIPVYRAIIDGEDTGMFRISLVDEPAVMTDFVAFKAEGEKVLQKYAVQDEEKRLVLGVVMRADFPIYRLDKEKKPYYIIYKAEDIRAMAEKYLAENRQNLVNLMHEDGTDVDGVQMVQYFIKDSSKGVAPEGFDVADGSLFAEFHVTNDEVWESIKAGDYKGFSLEGYFDLVPEYNEPAVEKIVDTLHGKFSNIIKDNPMAKLKGLLARLAKAIVSLGNITTDKGVLSWDGDEDLKAGDNAYIEDENGERTAAADGDYVTEDGKTIVIVDGKVSEIKDPKAEVATETDPSVENVKAIATDKGKLSWDNEDEDLKEGDAVYITNEDGEKVAAPDGDYTTEDGKVISVVDGKVASITDNKAEVEAAKVKVRFSESFGEKINKIGEAIYASGVDDFYIDDCGEDFAVASVWDEEGMSKYLRFRVTWNEDGTANVSDPVEVVLAYVTPEQRDAADAELAGLKSENENLRKEVEQLRKAPAATPAHEEFKQQVEFVRTGDKRIDTLQRILKA